MGEARRVVIGIGNEYRRDDGFGPAVLAELQARQGGDPRLSGLELRAGDGEPARLLDLWAGAGLAIVIDVLRAGPDRAGEWLELPLTAHADIAEPSAGGTHGIGPGSAVALGRALDRMPDRLVLLVVRGCEFGFGVGLTAPVAAAVDPVIRRIRQLALEP